MDLILMPSLERMALIKIAVALWSRRDLRHSISKSYLSEDKWQAIENSVVERASDLPISEILKEKLFTIIGPVGLRTKLWMEIHTDTLFIYPPIIDKLPPMLFWTPHGTIDNKKTAVELMKVETLDPYQRFAIASNYCLEDNIRDAWGKCSFVDCVRNEIIQYNDLTLFWFNYLKENVVHTFEDDFETYERLFKYSAESGNEVATRYFCFKLSPQRNVNIRMETALKLAHVPPAESRRECISDVLCFLLSTMNAEQQAKILEQRTHGILISLLSWPWQSLFLETAKRNMHFLSDQQYYHLLHYIVDRMHKHNNLQELFAEFCEQTLELWQQFFREKCTLGSILLILYKRKKENIIIFILTKLCMFPIEVGDKDHFSVGETKFDSSGFTFRRSDCTEKEFKWNEIFQLIEYCFYG